MKLIFRVKSCTEKFETAMFPDGPDGKGRKRHMDWLYLIELEPFGDDPEIIDGATWALKVTRPYLPGSRFEVTMEPKPAEPK